MWPSAPTLAARIKNFVDQLRKGATAEELRSRFTSTAQSPRKSRSPAPYRSIDPHRVMSQTFRSSSFSKSARSGFAQSTLSNFHDQGLHKTIAEERPRSPEFPSQVSENELSKAAVVEELPSAKNLKTDHEAERPAQEERKEIRE